jgi:rubredoxin
MTENTYKCAACGGVFEKAWSDEEAIKESTALWENLSEEESEVICDSCFQGAMASCESKDPVLYEFIYRNITSLKKNSGG